MRQETEPTRPQPFFARFLESQEYPSVETGVRSGAFTLKNNDDVQHTMKYPSDGDET